MLRSSLSMVGIVWLLAGVACGQVAVNVGPVVAPVGCDVVVSISNDTASTFLIGSIGPITVRDAAGAQVFFFQAFIFVAIPVAPGATAIYFRWDQRDAQGNQVPPGSYLMEVSLNGAMTLHPLVIGPGDAAIASLGVHRPGTSRNLYLCSPQDPGRIYALAASFTAGTGIPTCGGVFPLDNDPLLALSTAPGNGVFFNTVGTLNPLGVAFPGTTTDPLIALPNVPALSGHSFSLAFAVIDPLQSCAIVRISLPATITIL